MSITPGFNGDAGSLHHLSPNGALLPLLLRPVGAKGYYRYRYPPLKPGVIDIASLRDDPQSALLQIDLFFAQSYDCGSDD